MHEGLSVIRADSKHPDFIALVQSLDKALSEIDGQEHSFYAQYNKIDLLNYVVLGYHGSKTVACGAIKPLSGAEVEIKRMYVAEQVRGKGIAGQILQELERWAKSLSYKRAVLETGKRQPDAIALYRKHGYQMIPNYGQYIGIENSVCFEKELC
ncbi:MAG: GNAT family N-acetyltransferase [Cyclobacteriaceae bacterium]